MKNSIPVFNDPLFCSLLLTYGASALLEVFDQVKGTATPGKPVDLQG